MLKERKIRGAGIAILLACAFGCTKNSDNSASIPPSTPAIQGPQRQSVPNLKPGDVVKAVTHGDQTQLLQLLNAGADINESVTQGSYRLTPLIAAIVTRNPAIAAVLIRNGAALDPTYQGYSAEDLALYFDDDETAFLIRQYKKISHKTSRKRDPASVDAQLTPQDQLNRTTWAGNAIYHQKPEDLVIAAALKQLYRTNPHQDPGEALRIANRLRDEYRAEAKQADGGKSQDAQTIQEVADTMSAMAKTVPETAAFADAIHELGNWSAVLYDKTIGTENQIIAQLTSYQKYSALEDSGAVWEDVWSVAQLTPEAGLAIDGFLHSDLNATTSQASASILSNNPEFAGNAALLKLAGPDGEISIVKNQLETGLRQVDERLAELDQRNLDTRDSLQELTIEAREAKLAREAAAVAQARREQDQLELQGERSAVYVLSVLGGTIDPKLARGISTLGNAAIQISDSISKFSTLSTSAAGSAILTGNILGAVMSISSLFGDSGPTPDQILSQQLQSLSAQIDALSKHVDERIDHVDKELDAIMKDLNRDFALISSNLAKIDENVTSIEQSLLRQRAQVNQLGQDVFSHFSRSVRTDLVSRINSCLGTDAYSAVVAMNYASYRECLSDFAGYSTDRSSELLQDSDVLKNLADLDFSKIGDQLNKSGSIDANVELLSEISEKLFGSPIAPSYATDALTRQSLANPVEWAIGAQAYLDLAAAHPEFAKLTELSGVDRILEIGNRVDRALKNITSVATPAGPQPNVAFFHRVIDTYRQHADQAVERIRSSQNGFISDSVNQVPAGLNLWSDESQAAPVTGFGSIVPCNLPGRMFDVQLSLPPGLAEQMIPLPLRNAARLNLSNVDLCYDAQWNQAPRLASQKNPSSVQLSILVRVDGQLIARRSAISASALLDLNDLIRSNRNFNIPFNAEIPLVDGPISIAWNAADGFMKNQIASAATEQLPPYSGVLSKASQDFRAALAKRQQAFNLKLRKDMSGSLDSVVGEMSGIKILLRNYVELGLPESWKRDDYLRMLFGGKEQIFDRDELEAWLEDSVRGADPDELKKEIDRRADALEKELIREIGNAHGSQTYSALSATLHRLGDMKQDRLAILPKMPVEKAVAEIESKLAELQ